MTQLEAYLKVNSNLSYEAMLEYVWSNPTIQEKIVELNTNNQLFKGLDAEGFEFPDYSEASVEYFGKEPGPIKLYDNFASFGFGNYTTYLHEIYLSEKLGKTDFVFICCIL